MVQYGMKPIDAIRSATSVAAEALRMDSVVGTFRANANADVIAVQGDPTTTIADIKKVVFVMANGRIVKNRVTGHQFPWWFVAERRDPLENRAASGPVAVRRDH